MKWRCVHPAEGLSTQPMNPGLERVASCGRLLFCMAVEPAF